MWYNNILETIGNTPLVRLNNVTKEIQATVLAKVETTNPGNSIKDRMALKMIEDAEKSGKLKAGLQMFVVLLGLAFVAFAYQPGIAISTYLQSWMSNVLFWSAILTLVVAYLALFEFLIKNWSFITKEI